MIDSLTLVLCRHACQVLLLSLRDTQAIKGVLNVCWDIVPGFPLFRNWLDIIENVVEVNAREISAPGGHGTFLKECQALEAERAHPSGFAFHLGDLLNDFATQSSFGLKRVVFSHMEPWTIRLLFQIEYLTHRLHSILQANTW